jgi:quinol monooxygenase YgiN
MIVVRITMNVLPRKRLEVLQTLLSMIGPTGNETGCLSYAAYCDIEDHNCFSLVQEWKTHEKLNQYLRSNRFGVLLGTKALLCEPFKIQIQTVSHTEGMETVEKLRGKRN